MTRAIRHARILHTLTHQVVHSLGHLAEVLAAEGIVVNQTTLSRDFQELGIVRLLRQKAMTNEELAHALGDLITVVALCGGIALAAPALLGVPVAEYAANVVKKTIVGVGHAEKGQIAMMVRMLLPASPAASPDAADALALAITHAQHRGLRRRGAA